MLIRLKSATLQGMDVIPIDIEVDSTQGLPGEVIVGLPGPVIKESRNRVRMAIRHSKFKYPIKHITINLAPADLRKEGAIYDLPIALGILGNSKQVKIDPEAWYIGELGLNGEIKPTRGILSLCHGAKNIGVKRLFVPHENAEEAALIQGIDVIGCHNLKEVTQILSGELPYLPYRSGKLDSPVSFDIDLNDVRGHLGAKRLLEIAAAGRHHLLMIGSPGSGKSMLLKRLPTILPKLTFEEAIESLKLQSLYEDVGLKDISFLPPFRSPHHSISYAGMVGGGLRGKPGEISLAQHGVLFLDELPEFFRPVIDVLRQPLEDSSISISRANYHIHFPADFLLVAAMNPCPCGYYFDDIVECQCHDVRIKSYWRKISGPILDRLDIHYMIPRLKGEDFETLVPDPRYSSASVLERVMAARDRQRFRHQSLTTNGKLTPRQIEQFCKLPSKSIQLLNKGIDNGLFTARSYHKIQKISRTIADLEGSDEIKEHHVAEALQFRRPEIH